MPNTTIIEMPFSIVMAQLFSMLICVTAIILALNYIRKIPGTTKGFVDILFGFALLLPFILFSPLLGYLLKSSQKPTFGINFLITAIIFSISLNSALFISGGIKILGKKMHPISTLIIFALLTVTGLALEFGSSGHGYYPGSLIAAIGHIILGGCMIQTKSFIKTSGFKLSGWAFIAISLYYTLIYFALGEALTYVWFILPAFCIVVLLGTMLISNNLIWQRGNEFEIDAQESRKRLKLIIQSSPFPIVISHLKDDRLMLVNKKAAELFGINVTKPEKYKTSEYFADPKARSALFSKLETTPVVEDFEILGKRTDNSDPFWISVSARVIDFDYELALYMAFQNINNRKEKEIKLYDQATRDPLTGVYNRRQLEELIKNELNRSNRYGLTFSILMIDADHFKNVNDTYGHQTGDLVLKMITDTCLEVLRDADIIGRFGGEEFIIILPETNMENAYLVADRLRQKIANKVTPSEDGTQNVQITVSIGLAESNDINDSQMLIKDVDAALYQAKENGRNRVEKASRRGLAPQQSIGRSIPEKISAEDGIPKDDLINQAIPTISYEEEQQADEIINEEIDLESIENIIENEETLIIPTDSDDGIPLDDGIDETLLNRNSANSFFDFEDIEKSLEDSKIDSESAAFIKSLEAGIDPLNKKEE